MQEATVLDTSKSINQAKGDSLVAVDSPDDDSYLKEREGDNGQGRSGTTRRPSTPNRVVREGIQNLERLITAPIRMVKQVMGEDQQARSPMGTMVNDVLSSMEALAKMPSQFALAVIGIDRPGLANETKDPPARTNARKV